MADDKKQQDLQRVMMQIEANRRQMETFNRQGQLIESAMSEIQSAMEALNSLKNTANGTEILVSAGAGSFVKLTLKDNENVIVGIGADLSVEKKLPDALETLKSRHDEMAKSMEKISKAALELRGKTEELSFMAEGMLAEQQSPKK